MVDPPCFKCEDRPDLHPSAVCDNCGQWWVELSPEQEHRMAACAPGGAAFIRAMRIVAEEDGYVCKVTVPAGPFAERLAMNPPMRRELEGIIEQAVGEKGIGHFIWRIP